jgi:NitT/TauT family transport system ATP-binding protein
MTDYSYAVAETLVAVRNLSVTYDAPVLRDVNFELKNLVRPGHTQGQIDALLAPSGMGKTQLFRCISGLKKPDAGMVYLTEQQCEVEAGMVGVVAQDYPLFWHLTVFENVRMAAAAKLKDAKQASDVALKLLERFNLHGILKSYPHQISGGQRQRVAILQQMVCSGHLLLMDEPFSGLDPNVKLTVQQMIQEVAAADELNSIIVTTHDIESAVSIADTIVLLGRDRDSAGNLIPGARVQEQINLIDRGLAWRPDIEHLPAFRQTVLEIKERFKTL